MVEILLKIPGSGSNELYNQGVLLVRHPTPTEKFHQNSSTTFDLS